MMLANRTSPFRLFLVAPLVIAASCSDHTPSAPVAAERLVPPNAQADISDGAHGGNRNVWFLPPLARLPFGQPGFGDPFQPGLPVGYRVLDMSKPSTPIFKEIPPSQVLGSTLLQSYIGLWDTRNPHVKTNVTYRIEVVIGSVVPAFVDVKFVDDTHAVIIGTGDPVVFQQGWIIPIAVRVEKGWNCANASCTTEVVPPTIPGTGSVVISTPDNLNSVKFTGHWANTTQPVVVTIEDATSQPGGCQPNVNIVLAQNQCVKITTDPTVTLLTEATVGLCSFTITDKRELPLKYGPNEQPEVLEDAPPPIACPTTHGSTSKSSNPFVRLASAAAAGFGRIFGVKPAYAFDAGVGATLGIGDGFSYFSPILPVNLSIVSGDGQMGFVGSPAMQNLVVRANAAHFAVSGPTVSTAQIDCQTPAGTVPATNQGNGLYACPRPLLVAGTEAFKVSVHGMPDQLSFNPADGEPTQFIQAVTFSEHGFAPTLYGTDGNAGHLITVNTSTGGGAVVGALGSPSIPVPGLAWDPFSLTMFAGQGAGNPNILTVNLTTGAATLLANSGIGFAAVSGLATDPTGVLYASVNIVGDGGTGADHLARINKLTGQADIVGAYGTCEGDAFPAPNPPVGSCSLEGMEGIAFDANGTLWGTLSPRGRMGTPGLYMINPATGAATFKWPLVDVAGNQASGGFVSLAFAPNGTLYGGTAKPIGDNSDGGRLAMINPATGQFTFVGQTSATGGSSLAALAFGFVPSVTIP